MDFSALTAAISSAAFAKVASEALPFQQDWPHAIHILGYLYINDVNSARFLWKRIRAEIKEAKPEVAAAWNIGQRLWTHDFDGVFEAIRGF